MGLVGTKTHRHVLGWCLVPGAGGWKQKREPDISLLSANLMTGAEHVASSWLALLNSVHCPVISPLPSCICAQC